MRAVQLVMADGPGPGRSARLRTAHDHVEGAARTQVAGATPLGHTLGVSTATGYIHAYES